MLFFLQADTCSNSEEAIWYVKKSPIAAYNEFVKKEKLITNNDSRKI